ncbi:archaellin/type IV pilin N-terminal domain-containing protein [Pyrococcus kukulkanii]|uniref:archaellin/type IV pilin N-terminal domain-containing protein n=1 Tax=Pyrococcus kukulkanii TaxID=1609559 RepID=UPI003568E3B4
MGIGTLIVFIAMVLVAAVAAAVLINTSGFLQSRASTTGLQTTKQVANALDIVGVYGGFNDGNLSNITIYVKVVPGSDPIDLNATRILLNGKPVGKSFAIISTNGTATSETGTLRPGELGKIVITDVNDLKKGTYVSGEIVPQYGSPVHFGFYYPNSTSLNGTVRLQ